MHAESTRLNTEGYLKPEHILIAAAAGLALGLIITQGHRREHKDPRRRIISPIHSPNDRSRFLTIRALGDYGTYEIDQVIADTGWNTIDKVRRPDTGKFYSSKPPLLPTLLAYEYKFLKWVTGGAWSFENSLLGVVRTIVATTNWVPFVFFLIFLAKLFQRTVPELWPRLYALAAAAFGTNLSGFIITLNNHVIAACCCFFALYAAIQICVRDRDEWWLYAICGFFAAFLSCNELPSGLFSGILFLVLLVRSPQKTLLCFLPAALVPLAAFFWTNYQVTGDLLPAYMHKDWYKYEGSYWLNRKGIDAQNESWWLYLLNITVGHHGVLSLTPVILLGWIGILRVAFKGGQLRLFAWMALVVTVCMFAFYVGIPFLDPLGLCPPRTYGGMTQGFRWMFWLIPMWVMFIPHGLELARGRRWAGWLAVLLLAVSAMSVYYAIRNPWTRPWIHQLLWTYGLIGY